MDLDARLQKEVENIEERVASGEISQKEANVELRSLYREAREYVCEESRYRECRGLPGDSYGEEYPGQW